MGGVARAAPSPISPTVKLRQVLRSTVDPRLANQALEPHDKVCQEFEYRRGTHPAFVARVQIAWNHRLESDDCSLLHHKLLVVDRRQHANGQREEGG